MKFIRKLARSRLYLPVCGVLALLSLLYIGFTVREIVTETPMTERISMLYLLPNENEDGILTDDNAEFTAQEQLLPETFTARDEIMLPEAPMPEASLPEAETEISPSEQPTVSLPETDKEPSVKPPASVQKPQSSTSAQTQKPTESVTTKPQQTQKPAQTTKPQEINAWNVTLSQAKSMVKSDSAYHYEDLYWLSRIISAEAKGESFTGQIGVGTVVLNRVKSGQFPNTVKGVVFDKKYGTQFTPVANGSVYETPTESAVIAAKMCLDGYTLSNSVLYFLNPRISTSSWIQNNRKYAFRVGNHDFYY